MTSAPYVHCEDASVIVVGGFFTFNVLMSSTQYTFSVLRGTLPAPPDPLGWKRVALRATSLPEVMSVVKELLRKKMLFQNSKMSERACSSARHMRRATWYGACTRQGCAAGARRAPLLPALSQSTQRRHRVHHGGARAVPHIWAQGVVRMRSGTGSTKGEGAERGGCARSAGGAGCAS